MFTIFKHLKYLRLESIFGRFSSKEFNIEYLVRAKYCKTT